MSLQKVFENIYQNKVWYHGSGSGSLPSNTVEYRRFLQEYLAEHEIKSVVDAGCGDWQFSHLMDWSGIRYLGMDIVPSLIEENRKNWGADNILFICADALEEELPQADLLIMKDVLQHWANGNILRFLPKFKNFKRVLAVNSCVEDDFNPQANKDIRDGEARFVDLGQPPFSLNTRELFRYKSWRPAKKVFGEKNIVEILN